MNEKHVLLRRNKTPRYKLELIAIINSIPFITASLSQLTHALYKVKRNRDTYRCFDFVKHFFEFPPDASAVGEELQVFYYLAFVLSLLSQ